MTCWAGRSWDKVIRGSTCGSPHDLTLIRRPFNSASRAAPAIQLFWLRSGPEGRAADYFDTSFCAQVAPYQIASDNANLSWVDCRSHSEIAVASR